MSEGYDLFHMAFDAAEMSKMASSLVPGLASITLFPCDLTTWPA